MFPKGLTSVIAELSDDGVEDARPGQAYDELHVPCPPHTTELKLVSRIDWRLMPFVIIMYLLAFLDRVNIANAKSFSLTTDLKLGGTEYNTGQWVEATPAATFAGAFGNSFVTDSLHAALTMFFIPYVFFEIPSNILLKRLSPKI